MRANKCDRCGKFYTEHENKKFNAKKSGEKCVLSGISVRLSVEPLCGRSMSYREYSNTEEFDLCDDCTKELYKFLNIEILQEEKKTTENANEGICSIEIGDKLKCVDCGKVFTIKKDTFSFDSEAEYLTCPHCKKTRSVDTYYAIGEKA